MAECLTEIRDAARFSYQGKTVHKLMSGTSLLTIGAGSGQGKTSRKKKRAQARDAAESDDTLSYTSRRFTLAPLLLRLFTLLPGL